MIRTARLGLPLLTLPRPPARSPTYGTVVNTPQPAGNCPPGFVQNGSNCVLPQQLVETAEAGAVYAAQPGDVLTQAQIASYPSAAQPAQPTPIVMPNVSPIATVPTPVATMPAPAPVSSGNFTYTADIEAVQNQLDLSGDTWDSAQTIVAQLYAAGIAPGTVTASMALGYMTGAGGGTATAATTGVPWYYYAAGAAAALLLFSTSGRGRK